MDAVNLLGRAVKMVGRDAHHEIVGDRAAIAQVRAHEIRLMGRQPVFDRRRALAHSDYAREMDHAHDVARVVPAEPRRIAAVMGDEPSTRHAIGACAAAPLPTRPFRSPRRATACETRAQYPCGGSPIRASPSPSSSPTGSFLSRSDATTADPHAALNVRLR